MARGYDPRLTQPSSNSATPMATVNDIPSPNSFGSVMPVNKPGANDHEARMLQDESKTGEAPGYDLNQRTQDNWQRIYKTPDGSFKENSSQGEKPPNDQVDFDWDALFATYKSMGIDVGGGSGDKSQYTPGYDGPAATKDTDTWRNGSPGNKSASSGSSGGSVIYQGPVYDYPEYNRPEPFEYGATLDLPDYEPPEYDEGKERAVREEFIQTSKGAVSEAAQKAILGSANVNNPQARGQIIKAALEGFGESLGKIALAGSEAGRRAAEKKQATETGVYQAKFQIESKEKMARYDADMKAELMNWELDLKQADREYANQLSQWNSMPNDMKAKSMPGYNKTAGPPTGGRYF